ncbi:MULTISPECIES: hypothetical protein [Janthinobacterium]|jgi:hypothetical protein|nr:MULTISPECIES: hypothetical protein [Janthinobacterium]
MLLSPKKVDGFYIGSGCRSDGGYENIKASSVPVERILAFIASDCL